MLMLGKYRQLKFILANEMAAKPPCINYQKALTVYMNVPSRGGA